MEWNEIKPFSATVAAEEQSWERLGSGAGAVAVAWGMANSCKKLTLLQFRSLD